MPFIKIDRNPSNRTLLQFGLTGALVLGLLAVFAASGRTPWVLGGVAAALGLAGLLAPKSLVWPYRLLSWATAPIGFVVSWVMLAVIYYGVLTPTGFLLRRFRGDFLGLRLGRDRESYWTLRSQPEPRADRYFKQF
ncbi:MAG: hypothetical protein KDB53_01360 [Planctomycetes bacterium]|nr:hypothetical protein [Planctomycetota bacterium]